MFRDSMTGTDTHDSAASETSVTRLVSGIVDDAQELLRQQIVLLKHEVRRDLRDARQMGVSFVVSMLLGGIAVVLLSFMLVYLVNWLWTVPLWIGFGMVGCISAVVGVGLFLFAREKLEEMTPVSDEARDALKENLQWTRKPR